MIRFSPHLLTFRVDLQDDGGFQLDHTIQVRLLDLFLLILGSCVGWTEEDWRVGSHLQKRMAYSNRQGDQTRH